MKINKACDLSSISVLPPQSRRRSGISSSVPEMSSTFRHNQGPSQQQQQRSQQSLSQGFSSQHHAIFSQFSQNSQDETLTNDQLVVSQERESSLKRFSSLPPVNHTREEGQMPLSRSSTGLIRKWGSAISEQRCQMGEEFEHRIGTIESSLSRFGLMLESLQTDIMQVNKGTKELAMDMESIRQKLIANDNTFQMINKGQEDLKSSLHGDLKLISDQLNQDRCNKNSQDISILLSSLQEKIGVFISNLRNDLSKSFTNEMQAIACKLKALDQKNPSPTVLLPKAVSYCANPLGKAPKIRVVPPKIEMGTWNSVKREHVTLTNRDYSKGHKHNKVSQTGLDREWRVVTESDEDIAGGFTFLSEEKGTGIYSIEKAKEETERILRKARRRKRKQCNTIIIN
ncbi:protein PAIR1 isoform X2 [Cynara cardunculus var. scolymus]|uniref:protein PAIR1 isoform X2 n=1 Tax=Cynara cardunculus var. scolymus TaxID=59895 RepID=UPI000D6309F7|nr:protein PAIR1 isoform X2 [Cynara cardunculus var. scolymus]